MTPAAPAREGDRSSWPPQNAGPARCWSRASTSRQAPSRWRCSGCVDKGKGRLAGQAGNRGRDYIAARFLVRRKVRGDGDARGVGQDHSSRPIAGKYAAGTATWSAERDARADDVIAGGVGHSHGEGYRECRAQLGVLEEPVPTVRVVGAEATAESVKVTGALTPLTVAVTVNVPTVQPATRSGLVAVPSAPVWTAAVAPPPTKVAPAPLVVTTVKSTVVRDGGTIGVRHGNLQGAGSSAPTSADWLLPETAVTVVATPVVVLVRSKVTANVVFVYQL